MPAPLPSDAPCPARLHVFENREREPRRFRAKHVELALVVALRRGEERQPVDAILTSIESPASSAALLFESRKNLLKAPRVRLFSPPITVNTVPSFFCC